MKSIKNVSKNQISTTGFVLNEEIGKIQNFKILEYGIHKESCSCKCLKVQLDVDISSKEKLDKFIQHDPKSLIELKEKPNSIECILNLSSNRIRNLFHDYYEDILPKREEYIDVHNPNYGEVKLMLYKRKDSDEIQFEICNKTLCTFSKKHESIIENALFIHRKNLIWYVEGTGCKCSKFEPIPKEKLTKNNLLSLFIDLQLKAKIVSDQNAA